MLANIGTERATLAGLCRHHKNGLIEIEDVGINVESFTTISNQAIFSSLKHLLDNHNHVDQAMLLLTIQNLGYSALFDSKKDIEYIASLFAFPIEFNNIRSLAIRLEKIKIARKAIEQHNLAIESLGEIVGTESIEHIIQLSENPIFDLITEVSKGQNSGPHLLFEDIEEIVNGLKNNPCDSIGIPTPWKCYNSVIGGGMRRGGCNLIGGRPKEGKSSLAKEAILHFTNTLKIPALVLDTEMVLQDQLIRSLASTSKVPMRDIESGKFANNHLDNQRVDNAVQKLKQNKLFWYESIAGKPFEEVLAIIRRWIVKEVGYDENGVVNNCVVVYDYFKLMDRSQLDHLKEYEAMGFQISRLTDFCKEFDFPCLAFVQLNRERGISQSDRLRWLCHSYSTFEIKEPQQIVDDGPAGGNRKMQIMDTRFGGGVDSGDYICMNFQRDINKITEICLKSQLGLTRDEVSEEFEVDYKQNEGDSPTDDSAEGVPWETE